MPSGKAAQQAERGVGTGTVADMQRGDGCGLNRAIVGASSNRLGKRGQRLRDAAGCGVASNRQCSSDQSGMDSG